MKTAVVKVELPESDLASLHRLIESLPSAQVTEIKIRVSLEPHGVVHKQRG